MLNRWTVGDVRITRVVENEGGATDGSFLLMHGSPEYVSEAPVNRRYAAPQVRATGPRHRRIPSDASPACTTPAQR